MTIQANQGFGVSVFGATSAGGGGSTSPGGSSGQLQYNASGSFGGMAGTSWDDTNRALTLTGATVTTSQPVLNLSQTWNAGAVTFTGLKFNATDTASASGSLLLDLQVGGSSLFRINKNGTAIVPGGLLNVGYVNLATNGEINFNDLFLRRPAAATLQLGAADAAVPVAQTLQVQSVVAGTTNTAGANWTLKGSAGTGTGAGGSIIFQVAPAGTTGTAQNAYATALTIASDKSSTFAGEVLTANNTNFSASQGGGFQVYTTGSSGNRSFIVTAFSGLNTVTVANNWSFGWSSTATATGTNDTMLTRGGAATLQLGAADVSSGAVAQTLQVQSNTGATTTGPDFTILGSGGTTSGGNIILSTKATTTGAAALKITPAGAVLAVNATAGLGYGAGAGGTVTQATSRTTGVTLNKTCGAITLFTTTAVVGTWFSFTLTNSAIAATDTVQVSVKSGTNTYVALVSAVAAGSCQISCQSIAGTASDAPVINFAVVKAVTA